MTGKVAVNGLGRIGRAALKLVLQRPELELVAVNEIGSLENMAYLLSYDTVYGRYERQVEAVDGKLVIDGRPIIYLSEPDPERLRWGELGVDLVFECTGRFTSREEAEKHVRSGATWVVLSGPTKSQDVPTIVHGVNRPDGGNAVISCASCTTNSVTPLVEILDRYFGVQKALLTTIHAYTASQALVDGPGRTEDLRRGRSAAQNLVPSSTGAAHAAAQALPAIQDRFDGVAVRGPVVVGSLSDVVFLLDRDTTTEEVNEVFRQEAATDRYRDVLGVTDDPLVSADIIKDPRASIVQLDMTRVVGGNLVKVMSWYDNEWGFTNQLVKVAVQLLAR
jgi:glyceraldehyde 3-phosphate dehydrogenase